MLRSVFASHGRRLRAAKRHRSGRARSPASLATVRAAFCPSVRLRTRSQLRSIGLAARARIRDLAARGPARLP